MESSRFKKKKKKKKRHIMTFNQFKAKDGVHIDCTTYFSCEQADRSYISKTGLIVDKLIVDNN